MAAIGIEVVDVALVAARADKPLAASPGVAVLAPGGLQVGARAKAAERLQPVLAADRFWSDLALDSYARTADPPVSHADLAFAHLSDLWRTTAEAGDEAVFAVPGSMRLHQVGLLLGIARSLGITVAGVVDAGVAACAAEPARAAVLHLDVQLYQAVLTAMQGGAVLRRRRVEIAPRAGLKAMYSAWAQLVSESMVRRTRFDPLHQAATEQQLYERLPEWLAGFGDADSREFVIDTEAGSFSATVQRGQLALAAEAWYAQLEELVRGVHRMDEPATLLLSARASQLPDLAARLADQSGLDVRTLPEAATAVAAAACAPSLGPADPPALVTALARAHPVAARDVRRAGAAPATHVILEGRAHAIDERPLVIGFGSLEAGGRRIGLAGAGEGVSRAHCTLLSRSGRSVVRDHSRYGTFVNGERVDGEAELAAGDRLRVGNPGVVFELVAVD